MTVSKALRNHADLPATTCRRLQALARKMGYRPDPRLTALAAYRSERLRHAFNSTLALVIGGWSIPDGPPAGNPWLKSIQDHATEMAGALGFSLDVFATCDYAGSWPRLEKTLQARGIRGVLLMIPHHLFIELGWDWRGLAPVTLELQSETIAVDRATVDPVQAFRLVVRQLKARGYRRPAFAAMRDDGHFNDGLWAWLAEAARADFPEARDIPLFKGNLTDHAEWSRWRETHRPDVLVIREAIDPKTWRSLAGPKTPGALGLCSLNVSPLQPGLSGIDQNRRAWVGAAIERIHTLLLRNHLGLPEHPVTLAVSPTWIEGRTLRATPRRARQS
jgi:LacI family transcriptional regulator